MSADWQEATSSLCGLQWFTKRPLDYLAESQSQGRRPKCCSTRRANRCVLRAYGDFEAEETRWDRKACVEAKQGAIAGHPSDGASMRFPKVPFGGVYPNIM
jgi:hypothetical protein